MGNNMSVVMVGRIAGSYGIKGWVKVSSYTRPLENILHYGPWQLHNSGSGEFMRIAELAESRAHGKGLVAHIVGVDDRDQAGLLNGAEIFVDRDQLPEPDDGKYYWTDLEGMQVETLAGKVLGHVDQMLEAGAADVMVVCGDAETGARYLIPFIRDEVIVDVDLDAKSIRVDWDND